MILCTNQLVQGYKLPGILLKNGSRHLPASLGKSLWLGTSCVSSSNNMRELALVRELVLELGNSKGP
jgi:hypothetical protein